MNDELDNNVPVQSVDCAYTVHTAGLTGGADMLLAVQPVKLS